MIQTDITGYILAGGSSRRMGTDKRWITLNGKALIDHTCNVISNLLGKKPIIVADNLGVDRYKGCRILPDALPNKGPLGGLVACLKNCSTGWALVMPVDMPLMTEKELKLLLEAIDENVEAVAFSKSGNIRALPSLHNSKTADFWYQRLIKNELSLEDGIEQLHYKKVELSRDDPAWSNLNIPEDFKKLYRLVKKMN